MGSFYPHTFAGAETYLAGGKSKTDRPVANNTRLKRVDDDTIALVYHTTAVVTYHRDGTFTIYSGGWDSVTTKARIRDYSPVRPCSDGNGSWVVGQTGERTPPKVQKCRTCKGEGGQTVPRWCSPSYNWSDIPPRRMPCEHGEENGHIVGEYWSECYRCKGEGRTDYGSKPIPIVTSPYSAFKVDAEGNYLGETEAPDAPGYGYPKKSYPTTSAPTSKVWYGGELVAQLKALIPDVGQDVHHPVSGIRMALDTVIVNLNDHHGWSRERIADWLETLDLDLRFPAIA